MPVHDWSRVRPGKFHHFHNSWIYKISDRLNSGILPAGFYAAGEQVVGEVEPDVLTLRERTAASSQASSPAAGAIALAERPPQVRDTVEAEQSIYLRRQDRVVIRAPDDDRIIAMIEVVSRGNKESRHELDRFLRKIGAAIDLGYHLLIVDLHPPGRFDPRGIHEAVWEHLFGGTTESSGALPLTLVSYRVGPPVTAYLEPVAVGDALPDMPLFLDPGWYVNVPLEETYEQTWSGYPERWKRELAG